MQLEIRDYSSPDQPRVWEWQPASQAEVCFLFSFELGFEGEVGGYWFDVLVATPEGLRRVATQIPNYKMPDRAVLLFDVYSWAALLTRITTIVQHASREDWEKSLAILERYFKFEYEAS